MQEKETKLQDIIEGTKQYVIPLAQNQIRSEALVLCITVPAAKDV